MEAQLEFEADKGVDTYTMRLFHAAGDTLVFADESLSFLQIGYSEPKLKGFHLPSSQSVE